MTDEVKAQTKQYAMSIAWWFLNANEEHVSLTTLAKVLTKIEETETWFKDNGIKDQTINEIVTRAEKFVNTPLGQLTWPQEELRHKLMYGPRTRLGESVDKRS